MAVSKLLIVADVSRVSYGQRTSVLETGSLFSCCLTRFILEPKYAGFCYVARVPRVVLPVVPHIMPIEAACFCRDEPKLVARIAVCFCGGIKCTPASRKWDLSIDKNFQRF